MTTLFDPIQLGAIAAPNRILMAPLTRARATRDHVPTALMVDYYRQRASAGLIISEATGISRQGLGWPYAPGLWSEEQVEAWKPVTAAVHDAGGRIVAQLWHMGRLVHPAVTGEDPVSSSAIAAPGHAHTYEGNKDYPTPRPLEVSEIPQLLETYAHAARNARAAGFDGVQIHAANGYLIDEFLRNGVNQRTDDYGGSPENRAKMTAEELAKDQAAADKLMNAHWSVQDGVLVFDGKGKSLCTAKDYRDFEMYVDWKIKEKGDSGIYLRNNPQVQIWDPKLGNVGSGGLYNNQKNPSKPPVIADNPVGEWNTFRIKMVGEKVWVWLNGVLVVDNVTLENYWDRKQPIFSTGQIELQNHGNTLYFKNVFLREIARNLHV